MVESINFALRFTTGKGNRHASTQHDWRRLLFHSQAFFHGVGYHASDQGGEIRIRDCRAVGCAGDGYFAEESRVDCESSLARGCTTGFSIHKTEKGARLTSSIASLCRKDGFSLTDTDGITLLGCNANQNGACGFRLDVSQNGCLVACVASDNGRRQIPEAINGIRLEKHCQTTRLLYCLCVGMKNEESQFPAIFEAKSCSETLVKGCIGISAARRYAKEIPGSIVLQGQNSQAIDCLLQ